MFFVKNIVYITFLVKLLTTLQITTNTLFFLANEFLREIRDLGLHQLQQLPLF